MSNKVPVTSQQSFFKADEMDREGFNFELWANAVKHQMLAALEKRHGIRSKPD
ncbi:MAG TPA: hypothetical protein V6C57_29205 [Coleofasciculaceae cyanobacterium]